MITTTRNSLNIALVFDGFDQGGIGRVNLFLAKWLLDHGHYVDLIVFSTNGPRKQHIPKGAMVIDLTRSGKLKLLLTLVKYFKRHNPDGVFVSNVFTSFYVALARILARRSSQVIGIQHNNINTCLAGRPTLFYKVTVKHAIRFGTKFLDLRIAAVSEGAKTALARCTGVDPNAVHVLYNPVTLDEPLTGISEDLTKWWGEGNCKLLTVGRLTPEKGYVTLLDAIVQLKISHNPKLVIVGSGPYEVEIKRLVSERSLDNNVFLAGFHSNPRAFFECSDIFVLSSQSEAFPLTLVEALSVGKQVVSTDCDFGPREILEDGQWGKLVPVNDSNALAEAIRQTISSPTAPDALTRRALHFSPKISIERYLKLIDN